MCLEKSSDEAGDGDDEKELKKEIESKEKTLYEYIENAVAREKVEKRIHDLEEKADTLHLLKASRRKQIEIGETLPLAPLRSSKHSVSKQHKQVTRLSNRIHLTGHQNGTIFIAKNGGRVK